MSYLDYSKYFSEHISGPFIAVKCLSKPVKPLRDINLSEPQQQVLKDLMMTSARGQHKKLTLFRKTPSERAILLNAIAYKLKKTVCFISSDKFVEHYIGETEKNLSSILARAETEKWILFFDEADALFDAHSSKEKGNKDVVDKPYSYLLKRMSAYPGLLILSITTQTNFDKVYYASEHLD